MLRCLSVFAAAPRILVLPGASKDAVIDAYGWPNGSSQSGNREVLSYAQGQVTLADGRVERVDFSMSGVWPPPRSRPVPPSSSSVKRLAAPVDFWFSTPDDASRESTRRQVRILTLFNVPEWSPASQQFKKDVELHPEFFDAFSEEFVFLRLEFTTPEAIPLDEIDEKSRWRDRAGVTTYPSLAIFSAGGVFLGAADLIKVPPGANYRERAISAVQTASDAAVLPPVLIAPVVTAETVASIPIEPPLSAKGAADNVILDSSLFAARWILLVAVSGGVILVAGVFVLVWRSWQVSPAGPSRSGISSRISDAADGLPSMTEIATWPKERLVKLIAVLAESEGYKAVVQAGNSDKDISLYRSEERHACVLIVCSPSSAGVVPAKKIRELFGTLTAEGVDIGWFVSSSGFVSEARAFASQNQIILIDGEWIMARLRDIPPISVPRVLAQTRVTSPGG
ncbi:MAG: hypothetical protein RL077_4617 [Verrucomicrobiota bacterium]